MSGEVILNRNPDGLDVLHRYPSFESCNVDDAEGRQTIDHLTAQALASAHTARWCERCAPEVEGT